MNKIKVAVLIALLYSTSLFASNPEFLRKGAPGSSSYTTGIGLRGGIASGITLKHFISEDGAIDAIFSPFRKGFLLTGLYEYHVQAGGISGLHWYYGGGLHGGTTGLGIDAVLGIEYKIYEVPFTLGLDLKPALTLTNIDESFFDIGAHIRFAF